MAAAGQLGTRYPENMRKEGERLIIEPTPPKSLLALPPTSGQTSPNFRRVFVATAQAVLVHRGASIIPSTLLSATLDAALARYYNIRNVMR
jgi:hypothetical protein